MRVVWHGHERTWSEHVARDGFEDEIRLIQPHVFPAFAQAFLDWDVGSTLSPEEPGAEGKPDFTPADPVTHPFVFETKSSRKGTALGDEGDLAQVRRYLTDGRPRIRRVVLTNLVGIRIFGLDQQGALEQIYSVDLRALLVLPEEQAASVRSADSFARFVEEYSRKELSPAQKIERIRAAHPWEPVFEVTSSDWIIRRLDRVVARLQADVLVHIQQLSDPTRLSDEERQSVLDELRLLGSRLAEPLAELSLDGFVHASEGSPGRVALEQYGMHVAYYVATRLLLVRTWEDLGLLEPMLYDGGLDIQLRRFDEAIDQVVQYSFRQAAGLYRTLFQHSGNYSWFEPSEDVYIETIYELAFTYFGQIDSDILGEVYERLLARVDRKLLGQYYTPRDIIRLIWDLIGEDVVEETEREDRLPRVLDIATGSGGFLVEAFKRLSARLASQLEAGADIQEQGWINEIADALNGVEIQYFSRYLAELNLLVQAGQVVSQSPGLRIAPIGVIAGDTLSLHERGGQQEIDPPPTDQPERTRRLMDVQRSGFEIVVACGNPPYIGERLAAPLLARTRSDYPYWETFVAEHLDYLFSDPRCVEAPVGRAVRVHNH